MQRPSKKEFANLIFQDQWVLKASWSMETRLWVCTGWEAGNKTPDIYKTSSPEKLCTPAKKWQRNLSALTLTLDVEKNPLKMYNHGLPSYGFGEWIYLTWVVQKPRAENFNLDWSWVEGPWQS